MIAAARGAASSNTPWVLDPVGVGMSWRTRVVLDTLDVAAPAVIRRTPLRCWHWPVLVPPLEARRREMLLKMPCVRDSARPPLRLRSGH